MFQVKVLKLKEIFIKFLLLLFLMMIFYLLILILLKRFLTFSTSFSIDLFENTLCINKSYTSDNLNLKLVQNESSLQIPIIKEKKNNNLPDDDLNVYSYQQENNTIIKSEADNDDYISYDNIKHQKSPEHFEVKELPSGKIQVGNVFINNYSKIKLNLSELSKVSNFIFNDSTSFLIFHTHTSEAYEEIGVSTNFRTTDNEYNVVAVGNVLAENLKIKNYDVLHDITKHDTPSYNGAYKASLNTVEKILKDKKYDILIDLHRDALPGNLHFRPTTQINGETSAKLMFVIGTNASGLSHDNWMENLKLALLIQNTAEQMYPGLFRDLNLSKSRYNQHLSNGAFILEVGSTGNTLNDTKNAMKYLSNVFSALKDI